MEAHDQDEESRRDLANNGRVESGTIVEERTSELRYSIPADAEIEAKLQAHLGALGDKVDSPKTLLILRNSVLMLLEVGDEVDNQSLILLIADREYRKGVVNRLTTNTPNYWDQTWNSSWTKEIEPLYSRAQQRITRRRSLISFWTKEWDTLPPEQVRHAAEALVK